MERLTIACPEESLGEVATKLMHMMLETVQLRWAGLAFGQPAAQVVLRLLKLSYWLLGIFTADAAGCW